MHLYEAGTMLRAVISIKNCALEIVIGEWTLGIKLLWWLRVFLQFSEHCVIKFTSSQAMDVCPQCHGNEFQQLNRIKIYTFLVHEAISSVYNAYVARQSRIRDNSRLSVTCAELLAELDGNKNLWNHTHSKLLFIRLRVRFFCPDWHRPMISRGALIRQSFNCCRRGNQQTISIFFAFYL